MAAVRDLLVRITGDGAELERELGRSIRNLDAVGRRAERIGRDLTLKFTAPLVAAGAVATKLAVDFDSEMTKIVTLVGVAEDQVNDWRRALLDLGPAVGKTPQELARALFVVTSAGQRGADALNIVERAAKASAVGLGDTAAIARTVTAAMQAYGPETLGAARATDILVATVREGNFEVEALAGSISRVLPIAASVGVTFDQVGAFIATFTRLGISAEEAVVSLRGVLNTLQDPSQRARDALKGMELSVEDLRVSIVERGLARTLVDLVQRAKETGTELSAIVPNVRALTGVLATAGAQAEEFGRIADSTAGALGILDDAFARVEQKPAHTFAQLRASVAALAISIGDALAPSLNEVLRTLLPFLRTLREVDPELIKNAARAAALVAALGPLILGLGSAARTAATLANTLLLARGAGLALGSALLPAAAVMVGLGLLVHWLVRTQTESVRAGFRLAELRAEIMALGEEERRQRGLQIAIDLDQTLNDLDEARRKLRDLQAAPPPRPTAGPLGVESGPTPGIRDAAREVARLEEAEAGLRAQLDAVNAAQRRTAESARQLAQDQAAAEARAREMMEEFERLGTSADEAGKKLRTPAEILADLDKRLEVARRLGELSDAFDAPALSAQALQGALQELSEQLDENDERVQGVAARLATLRAEIASVEAVEKRLAAQLELAAALGEASADSFDAQALAVSAYEEALRELITRGLDPSHPAVQRYAASLADLRLDMETTARDQRELNDAVSLALSLIASARTPWEEYVQTIQALELALEAGRIKHEEFAVAVAEAARRMEEAGEQAGRAGQAWEDQFAAAVVASSARIRLSLRGMATDVIRSINQVILRLLAMRALMAIFAPFAGGAGIGAAIFSAASAPFQRRQHGGDVRPGVPYIVGEAGPEVRVFSEPGRILPNQALAGAGMGGGRGPSASDVAGEILRQVGPPPSHASPEVLHTTDFYQKLIGQAFAYFEHRGGTLHKLQDQIDRLKERVSRS